jgi:VanZ family protein
MKKFLFLWLPVFVWMGIILAMSSRQRIVISDAQTVNFLFFKTLHILEYGVLFALTRRAMKYGSSTAEKNAEILAFFIVALFAVSDEFYQRFVPTREGTLRDVIIDCLGALLAWILIKHSKHILPLKLRNWLKDWQVL